MNVPLKTNLEVLFRKTKVNLYISDNQREVIEMYRVIEILSVLLSLVGLIYFSLNKEKFKQEIEQKKKEKENKIS